MCLIQKHVDESISDSSMHSHVVTTSGNVSHKNDNAFIGKSSLYFDQNDKSYLSIGDVSDFNFLHNGTSDFTIEFWAYIQNDTPSDWFMNTLGGASKAYGNSILCTRKWIG